MAVFSALALTLALLAQDAAVQPPEATPAPAPARAVESQPPEGDPPLPTGAPADDYAFVNWCWGALTGHMALYPRVRDQLDPEGYPADEQQMAAGRAYLALYEQAVAAADRASPTVRTREAIAGRNAGAGVWAAADNVDAVTLKWAYLGWSLPGRCEVVSRRLLANAEMMAPALRTSSVAAAGPGVSSGAMTSDAEATATSAGGGLGAAAAPAPTPNTAEPVEPPAAPPLDPTAEPSASPPA